MGKEFLSLLVAVAKKKGASDIHLKEGSVVSFRIKGDIVRDKSERITTRKDFENLFEAFELDVQRLKKNRHLDAGLSVGDSRLRLHFSLTLSGYTLSIRLISMVIPDFKELNLPEKVLDLVNHRAGLVIVTGATGSGKSTTLASIINHINKNSSKHIITIEDPIEYLYQESKSLIEQREVGIHVNSFDDALVQAMREDPDILLVGELRDLETIQSALRMAETGHLVFGTLHTRGAAESFNRLLDVFPGDQQDQVRSQLANFTLGVVSQQLVKTYDNQFVPLCELLIMNSGARGIINTSPMNVNALSDNIQTKHKTLGSQKFHQSAVWLVDNGLAVLSDFEGILTEEELDSAKKLIGR